MKEGRLGLRKPLSGVAQLEPLPGTIALLFVMIGTVMFDGASEGSPWVDIAPDIQDRFIDIGLGPASSLELTFTVGMLIALGDRRPDLRDRRLRDADDRPTAR